MLKIGDVAATDGMTKGIYDELRRVFDSDIAGLSEDQRASVQESWKKLSFAIANGVINHILSDLEIIGIETKGNISAAVSGNIATQNGVTFTQSNNGTGRVQ